MFDPALTVVELWPMPMVGFDLHEDGTEVEDLIRESGTKFEVMLARAAGIERSGGRT